MSGLVDPDNAKKLGQIAGVDAIITGTITPFDKVSRVSIKVIATDTAKIIGAARGEITKTGAIEKLWEQDIPAFEGESPSEKPAARKAPRFKLGPISVDVEGVKNANSDLQVFVAITNQSNKDVYVFAGSPHPMHAAQGDQWPGGEFQRLTGRASDNKNSTFWLDRVEGFTRVRDKYFPDENLYVGLAPKESSKASFLLRNVWLTGPELGKTVNVSIEFAIVNDLKSKGSHQTKALTLTNWPLE